jgi:DNA-binding LytR/AlgR family response regulator
MAKISILIVEDELIVAKDIELSLGRLGYVVKGSTDNGEEAIQLAEQMKPDVIFMDIMLKGEMNGIEASKKIKERTNIPVIFLTAYADEDTLKKAIISEPYGYIIKPFKEIDLHTSIEMALHKNKKEKKQAEEKKILYSLAEGKDTPDSIFVKSKSKLIKLKTSDIFFIEALKDYVVINTLDKRYTIHSTMKEMDRKMDKDEFIRVHRSFIVRIDRIEAIEYPNLQLEMDKKLIPIGGSYKEKLMKKINVL